MEEKFRCADEKTSLLFQKDKLLLTLHENVLCIVCADLTVLNDLLTLTCCGQHLCESCVLHLRQLPVCPYCRHSLLKAVLDRVLVSVKKIFAEQYSNGLPEL